VEYDTPFGQRFAPLPDAFAGARVSEINHPFVLDRRAVDVQHTCDHLDAVARTPNDPFDVVGRVVLWQAKHDHVSALRLGSKHASGKEVRRAGERIMRVPISVLRYENVIADEQRRLHCRTWNAEGLEQKRSEQDCEH